MNLAWGLMNLFSSLMQTDISTKVGFVEERDVTVHAHVCGFVLLE